MYSRLPQPGLEALEDGGDLLQLPVGQHAGVVRHVRAHSHLMMMVMGMVMVMTMMMIMKMMMIMMMMMMMIVIIIMMMMMVLSREIGVAGSLTWSFIPSKMQT